MYAKTSKVCSNVLILKDVPSVLLDKKDYTTFSRIDQFQRKGEIILFVEIFLEFSFEPVLLATFPMRWTPKCHAPLKEPVGNPSPSVHQVFICSMFFPKETAINHRSCIERRRESSEWNRITNPSRISGRYFDRMQKKENRMDRWTSDENQWGKTNEWSRKDVEKNNRMDRPTSDENQWGKTNEWRRNTKSIQKKRSRGGREKKGWTGEEGADGRRRGGREKKGWTGEEGVDGRRRGG